MTFTADCGFMNEYSIVCVDFDEIDMQEKDVTSGVTCFVLNVEGRGVDSFECYAGHMDGCNTHGIPAVAGTTEFASKVLLACDIYDEDDVFYESFECYKDVYEGCETYGVNSPGSHSIPVKIYCDKNSLGVICTESPCGSTSGYSIWYDGSTNCVPDAKHIEDTTNSFFEAQFEKMLYNFKIGDATLYHIADVNLSLDLNNRKVVSTPIVYTDKYIAFEGLTPVIKEEELESYLTFFGKTNFTYAISPYFEVELPYNPMVRFPQIGEKAISAVKACGGDADCVESNVGNAYRYTWNATATGDYMLFDLKHNEHKAISRTPEGEIVYSGLPARFAIKI